METTFIPKINYMSMMLDSDSDTSMEINAMAMKYLKDEQLTKLTKLQNQAVIKGTKETHRLAALRHILAEERVETTPNVTTLGMSPNDLTFATRKYMEKHGLLNDSKNSRRNSADDVLSDESYQLRMNYSSNSSNTNTPARVTRETVKTPSSDRLKTPVQFTPENNRDSKKTKCPSGNVSSDNKSPYVNSYNTDNNSRLPNTDLNFTHTPKNTPNRETRQGQGHNYSSEKLNQDVKQNKFHTPTRNNLNGDVLTTPKQGHRNGIDHVHNKGNIRSPLQNTPKNTRTVERVISPIAQNSPIQRHIESGHFEPKGDKSPSPPTANESWDDADKILDITRLKQLPKLL